MNTNEQDQLLLNGLATNEKDAIETIYKDHYGLIQHLVMTNNGTEDDARDIFQEGLIVLYEKSKSGHFELNCQLKTYLYSVCRRLWLKRLQKYGRFEPHINGLTDTVPVEEDLDQHDEKSQQFGVMEMALQRLGEPCKGLLEAYYLQKRNMQDIADDYGYTNADNAKNQKYKCLVRLKKLFFAQYKNRT